MRCTKVRSHLLKRRRRPLLTLCVLFFRPRRRSAGPRQSGRANGNLRGDFQCSQGRLVQQQLAEQRRHQQSQPGRTQSGQFPVDEPRSQSAIGPLSRAAANQCIQDWAALRTRHRPKVSMQDVSSGNNMAKLILSLSPTYSTSQPLYGWHGGRRRYFGSNETRW